MKWKVMILEDDTNTTKMQGKIINTSTERNAFKSIELIEKAINKGKLIAKL